MTTKATHPSLPYKLFKAHPEAVDETYWQHGRAALRYAGLLAVASGAALIHAIIPALCETTARRIIRQIINEIDNRHGSD